MHPYNKHLPNRLHQGNSLSLHSRLRLHFSHHVGSVSQRPGGLLQLLSDLHQTVVQLQAQTEQQTADPGPQTGLIIFVFVLVLLDPQLPLTT